MEAMSAETLLWDAETVDDVRAALELYRTLHSPAEVAQTIREMAYGRNHLWFALMDEATALQAFRRWNVDCIEEGARVLGYDGHTFMAVLSALRAWVDGTAPKTAALSAYLSEFERYAVAVNSDDPRQKGWYMLLWAAHQVLYASVEDFKNPTEDGPGCPYIAVQVSVGHRTDPLLWERFRDRAADAYLLPALGLEVTP